MNQASTSRSVIIKLLLFYFWFSLFLSYRICFYNYQSVIKYHRRFNSLTSSDATDKVPNDLTTTSNNKIDNTNMKIFIPKRFKNFPFEYRERISVTISDITNLGSGVGRKTLKDGSKWVVHVPYTLPGEEVLCQVYQNHKSYSEADLIEVVTPSLDRVKPSCRYFETCGGCQYQHISVEAQRKWKKEQVVQLLKRIGGFKFNHTTPNEISSEHDINIPNEDISESSESSNNEMESTDSNHSEMFNFEGLSDSGEVVIIPEVSDVIGTAETYGYRAKLTPHYDTPKQLKPGQALSEDDIRIGFQMKSYRRIVDIHECIIALPDVNVEFAKTRQNLKSQFIASTTSSSSISTAAAGAGAVTSAAAGMNYGAGNSVKLTPTSSVPLSSAVTKLPKNGATLLFRQVDEGVVTDPRQIVTHTIDNIAYKFKAGEFFQNNLFILPYMVDYVINQATGDGCTQLLDTYCGSGLFALAGSKHFERVWGIEISNQAIEFAKFSAQHNNLTNTQFMCGSSEDIFAVISSDIPKSQRSEVVVIIDPPRKGCDEIFLKSLFSFYPKKLVYISCDPSTQARDARFICRAGYRIQAVQPFDFFPQTRHIENVIVFIRD